MNNGAYAFRTESDRKQTSMYSIELFLKKIEQVFFSMI